MKKEVLTAKGIDSLESKKNKYEISEGNGFLLRVLPSGKKFFYLTYTFQNLRRKMSLGEYPYLSLANAHKKADEYRTKIANGIDPLKEKEDARNQTVRTIEDLGKQFVERHCKEKRKSWKEDERILNTYILQQPPKQPSKQPSKQASKQASKPVSKLKLHKMMIKDVRRRHIKIFCEDISKNRGKVMANRVFSFIRTMFNYAIEYEILEFTPCIGLKNPGGEERKKERYLRDEEIIDFWNGLNDSLISPPIASALKLILLTGQRPSEVCGINSNEINERWWVIPGERTKNGRNHSVYLTDLAINIIGSAEGAKFVSPVTGKIIDRHQIARAISRKFVALPEDADKYKHIPTNPNSRTRPRRWDFEKFTPHDLRRTCATHLVGLGFNQLLVGHILNHTDQSVTSIYNQYSYDKEKQEAMEKWEEKIKKLVGLDKKKTPPKNDKDEVFYINLTPPKG